MARKSALWLVLPLTYFLYFYHLAAVGLIGPDEPRYAFIGRAMAESGDWITPRLLGQPWFEKPALLYWMEALGFRLGLGPELAPRLPVALLAVAFLVFFWWIVEREFGSRPAWLAAVILGSSVGWAMVSQIGVTDLPLSACFSGAMLLALPWVRSRDRRFLPGISALLGLAVLAKGPVALALAAPILIPWKREPAGHAIHHLTEWLKPRVVVPFLIVAVPWYALCAARNGSAFLIDFFWKHNLQRFTSSDVLQHGQPFWFYFPIVLAALLPWTPLLPLTVRRGFLNDPRRRFLLAWAILVLAFFSTAANKLPAYILPLAPAAAVLLALALDEVADAAPWLLACALLLIAFPIAAPILPIAVAEGLTRAPLPAFEWYWLLPLGIAALVWLLERRGRRLAAVLTVATGVTAGIFAMKQLAAPGLDTVASARAIWRQIEPRRDSVCIAQVNRGLRDSLNYYAAAELPSCADDPKPLRLRQPSGQPPALLP